MIDVPHEVALAQRDPRADPELLLIVRRPVNDRNRDDATDEVVVAAVVLTRDDAQIGIAETGVRVSLFVPVCGCVEAPLERHALMHGAAYGACPRLRHCGSHSASGGASPTCAVSSDDARPESSRVLAQMHVQVSPFACWYTDLRAVISTGGPNPSADVAAPRCCITALGVLPQTSS